MDDNQPILTFEHILREWKESLADRKKTIDELSWTGERGIEVSIRLLQDDVYNIGWALDKIIKTLAHKEAQESSKP